MGVLKEGYGDRWNINKNDKQLQIHYLFQKISDMYYYFITHFFRSRQLYTNDE